MNLSEFFTGPISDLASILSSMVIGVILAACIVFINKQTIGKFVKRLFDEKATSEDTAKTLEELGFEKSRILRHALRSGSTLRKMVMACSDGSEEESSSPLRFYIPDEKAYRAEITYNPDGSSILTLVIATLMFIVVATILVVLIPDLIQMASNAIDKFKTLGN